MPTVAEVAAALERRYPLHLAEDWDRVGLVVGDPDAEVTGVLATVDVTDAVIAERLGLRPDAVVISNGTPEADAALPRVLSALRRGNLHARRSGKATKNIGKLLQDAARMNARYCVILESGLLATLKDMATGAQSQVPLGEVVARIARR